MLSGGTACSLRSRCPPGPPLLARETRTRNLPVKPSLAIVEQRTQVQTPKHARQSCTSVFKNRIDIAIGSVDLSSLLEATLLRKEVIQPQVLLQLPCYDFTPITKFTIET